MISKLSASKSLLIAGLVAASGVFIVYTIKHYLKRRKYAHIQGPKTKGYFKEI